MRVGVDSRRRSWIPKHVEVSLCEFEDDGRKTTQGTVLPDKSVIRVEDKRLSQ